jgi:acyl carrier protein
MNFQQEVRQFVIDNFLFGREGQLSNADSFLESGIIDSTGVLELISFIEEHFGLKLSENDLTPDNLDSVDKVAGLVARRLATRQGAT